MWQPLNETVFVEPDEIEVSALVPEHLRKSMVELVTGTVVRVGTGTLLDSGHRAPIQVKVGDKVMFGTNVGKEITVDKKKLLLLAEANIIAVYVAPLKTTFILKED